MDQLSGPEHGRLLLCEQVIEQGKRAWIEMGRALREIRDARLYRASHATFEEYCEQRWQISRRRAYQLVDGSIMAENVYKSTQMQALREGQLRPLAPFEPAQQREVWAEAEAAAPRDKQGRPKVTAQLIKKAIGKVVPLRRASAVTLRPGRPEESAQALLDAWEPRDLVKLYSELGYRMRQRGMLNWDEIAREVIKDERAG